MKQKVLNYNAIFQKEDKGYSVWVPALNGCASQGETFEEAMKNIKEAIHLYLEDETEGQTGFEAEKQFMVPVAVAF